MVESTKSYESTPNKLSHNLIKRLKLRVMSFLIISKLIQDGIRAMTF